MEIGLLAVIVSKGVQLQNGQTLAGSSHFTREIKEKNKLWNKQSRKSLNDRRIELGKYQKIH